MKRKLILTYCLDKRDTTAFWRAQWRSQIYHNKFEIRDISDLKDFDWTVFEGVDIFWMQRPFALGHLQVITAAKNAGVRVVLDYDDELTVVDMYNPTYIQYKNNLQNTKNCIKSADEIWVSTQAIKDSYLQYNANIHIIPNSHNERLFPITDKKAFTYNKKCYYRGGASHQADVYENANKWLDIINNNKDWTFAFLGDRYIYMELLCNDNYHIVGGLTILEYFRYLNKENPSLMIFPLRDTLFNRAKSNICWLESTYAGAAFAGNIRLPEFDKRGIADINNLGELLLQDQDTFNLANKISWEYICDNLLSSNINKLRTERILANL